MFGNTISSFSFSKKFPSSTLYYFELDRVLGNQEEMARNESENREENRSLSRPKRPSPKPSASPAQREMPKMVCFVYSRWTTLTHPSKLKSNYL